MNPVQIIDGVEKKAGTSTSENNFSFESIVENITVPLNQQMAVFDELDITSGYELVLNGSLILEA